MQPAQTCKVCQEDLWAESEKASGLCIACQVIIDQKVENQLIKRLKAV